MRHVLSTGVCKPFPLRQGGGDVGESSLPSYQFQLGVRGVPLYDIKDLMGHTIAGATSVYARLTPETLEQAVLRLAENKGKIVKFERRVG